jgi:hypothetical protein
MEDGKEPDLTVIVADGLADDLAPLSNPAVREEVTRRLAEAGLRVTVIQIPSRRGRHSRRL